MTSSPSAKTLSRLQEPSSSVKFSMGHTGITIRVTGNSIERVKQHLQRRSNFTGENWTVEPGDNVARFHGPKGRYETLVNEIVNIIKVDEGNRPYDDEKVEIHVTTAYMTYTWYAYVGAKQTLTFGRHAR